MRNLVSILLSIPLFFISPGSAFAEQAKPQVDVAIVFMLDRSPSMNAVEMIFARKSHAEAIKSKEVVSAILDGYNARIAVAFTEFDTDAHAGLGWTIIDGQEAANSVAKSLTEYAENPLNELSRRGDTNFASGFEAAVQLIDALPYETDRIVVDVVGDGIHNSNRNQVPVSIWHKRLLDKGVTINGMPLMHEPDAEPAVLLHYYKTQVIGGPGAFLIPLEEMPTLPVLLRQKIVRELY